MKFIVVLFFIIAGLLSFSAGHAREPRKIVVYNWTEYIPENAIQSFTQETGIEVDYQTYTSNEEMYDRVKNQKGVGIDVIVPSTYYVSRMQKEGLLQSLNLSRIYNFNQLDPTLLNRPFDSGNKFSLPYLWGSTGIAVNTQKIDLKSITSWSDLWDKQWAGRVMLTDDVREVFHMALAFNGYSTNTQDEYELKSAFRRLKALVSSVSAIEGDSPRMPYLNGDADIGMIWSGEAIQAKAEGLTIEYIYPKEGAVFWMDSFAIPAGSKKVYEAHQFIDFMLGIETAIDSVEELGYATSNIMVRERLPETVRDNPIIFPDTKLVAQGEFQEDLDEETTQLLDDYWQYLRGEVFRRTGASIEQYSIKKNDDVIE